MWEILAEGKLHVLVFILPLSYKNWNKAIECLSLTTSLGVIKCE